MKINIEYHDDSAITVEEVVKQARHLYGNNAKIEVKPDSHAPHDQIYFALQQILTYRQLSAWYDSKFDYSAQIKLIRAETISKLEEIVDSVILDNERRIQ